MTISSLYLTDGLSCQKISDIKYCSPVTVYNKLKILGINLRSKSEANKKFSSAIAWFFYNLGLSLNQVGVLLGLNASTICKRFKKEGFPTRDRDVAKKIRYTQEEFERYFVRRV